jgi:hypothetical protein
MLAGGSHYLSGGKNCSTGECFLFTPRMVCECCGMQLRAGPAAREKVRVKKKTLRKIKKNEN